MPLKFKPKNRQVRLIYSDNPSIAVRDMPGKVFAVIGPFDCHSDKLELQKILETILRGYNVEKA